MNQDKDIIDMACVSDESSNTDDLAPIGKDYKEVFKKL